MRFIVDRCAGRRLAEWLRDSGQHVLDTRNLGPDPGDTALLERAASENRVLITVDKDFGELIYLHGTPHAGLVRLPDVRMPQRIALIEEIIRENCETPNQAVQAGFGRPKATKCGIGEWADSGWFETVGLGLI